MSFSESGENSKDDVHDDMEKLENAYFKELIIEHGIFDNMERNETLGGELSSLDDDTMASLEHQANRIPRFNSDPYYQLPKFLQMQRQKHPRGSTGSRIKYATPVVKCPTPGVKYATPIPGPSQRVVGSPQKNRVPPTPQIEENRGYVGRISRLLSSASIDRLLSRAPSVPAGYSIRKSDRATSGTGSGSASAASIDGETVPETPPGFRGVIEIPSKNFEEEEIGHLLSSKQKYMIAACLGVFLIAGIAVCATVFSNINHQGAVPDTVEETFDDWEWTFKPTQAPSSSPTISLSPTIAPTTESPTKAPTPKPSQVPTIQPSSTPTNSPTVTPIPSKSPTMAPTFTKAESFTQIMARISPSTLDEIEANGSPQNRAFNWIVGDPEYYSYSEGRIIQRWVLALFSLEISATRRANRRLNDALDTWMEYTDECQWWLSSHEDNRYGCDDDGLFRNLVIQDTPLHGSIPSELFLLTTLKRIVLTKNKLVGTLPKELGKLQHLEELILTANRFEGSIPTSIKGLEQLHVLDLGHNLFTGGIPEEFGMLEDLGSLDLRNNEFSGTVPLEISDMSRLKTLELSANNLWGTVPSQICSKNFDDFSVDCNGEVECDCCTSCESDVTAAPSVGPPTPQPTPMPTPPPTPQPTPQPSSCFDRFEISKSCFEVGETIEVDFGDCDEPRSDDWVALYHASADSDNLQFPLLWLWTCGNQTCRKATRAGALHFDASANGLISWPLQEGTYQIHMLRNSLTGGPFESFKESREIQVVAAPFVENGRIAPARPKAETSFIIAISDV
eukprot:scaffold1525_cov142-Cylindrotheca_fusiformis.AAC.87